MLQGDSIAIATQVVVAFGSPEGSATSGLKIFILESIWQWTARAFSRCGAVAV
jgi:hypothetical protein